MNRRERLISTLKKLPVDRPPVCFYELNGLDENPKDLDPFNIYSDPSWKSLIELTHERTDRIVMRKLMPSNHPLHLPADFTKISESYDRQNNLITKYTLPTPDTTLTMQTQKSKDLNTIWTTEHLLKDINDLKAYLQTPFVLPSVLDISEIQKLENTLVDTGIVMIDTPDPLCLAAELFDMATFTIIAMTEKQLFHQLLKRFADVIYEKIRFVSDNLPGRLWRIYGPEYASPPYLPPELFAEYVLEYDKPIVKMIQQNAGFARIHCHGNIKSILDHIAATGCLALDPIEPPPQGDVELKYVREKYGQQLILFGNLEVSDIENLPTPEFEKKVLTALKEGFTPQRTGFVLMPSSCPYGRNLPNLTLSNYQRMVELTENF